MRPFLRILVVSLVLWIAPAFAGDVTFETADGTVYVVKGKSLGTGANGDVYRVEKIPKQGPRETLAVKVYFSAETAKEAAQRDAPLMQAIADGRAPHLIPLSAPLVATRKETQVDDGAVDFFGRGGGGTRTVTIRTMPLAEGATDSPAFKAHFAALRDPKAKPTQVLEALRAANAFAAQTSSALGEVFAAGMVHGDVKPQNFLFYSTRTPPGFRTVLIDYDFAQPRGAAEANKAAGSPPYTAPEVLGSEKGPEHTNPARDAYAWACSQYELLFGEPPVLDMLTGRGREHQEIVVMGAIVSNQKAILERVNKRFKEMEDALPNDPEVRAEFKRLRDPILAGLNPDPVKRMAELQKAAPSSPLVRHMPKPGLLTRLACRFRDLKARILGPR